WKMRKKREEENGHFWVRIVDKRPSSEYNEYGDICGRTGAEKPTARTAEGPEKEGRTWNMPTRS
ncbi:MAG: hypothetical protein II715_03005, partial [Clostridia bacterium]|nr:hypothetical protein [Clostridia bacterium]